MSGKTVDTQNYVYQQKQMIMEMKDNREKYISRELDLNAALDKTQMLYEKASDGVLTVSKVSVDSDLIKLQSEYAKETAKNYQVDNLVFEPVSFCKKLKFKLCPGQGALDDSQDEPSTSRGRESAEMNLWKELGPKSRKYMNTVPNFSFIYGTFDADPIPPKPKVRKQVIKDKLGDVTRPLQLKPGTSQNEQDVMLRDAERVYSILLENFKKRKRNAIPFLEFVTDLKSFTHTVENIFLVSLLVKDGYVAIIADDEGFPYLRKVRQAEKEDWGVECAAQSVLTLTYEDWEDIVETFKIKQPMIPPRESSSDNHEDAVVED